MVLEFTVVEIIEHPVIILDIGNCTYKTNSNIISDGDQEDKEESVSCCEENDYDDGPFLQLSWDVSSRTTVDIDIYEVTRRKRRFGCELRLSEHERRQILQQQQQQQQSSDGYIIQKQMGSIDVSRIQQEQEHRHLTHHHQQQHQQQRRQQTFQGRTYSDLDWCVIPSSKGTVKNGSTATVNVMQLRVATTNSTNAKQKTFFAGKNNEAGNKDEENYYSKLESACVVDGRHRRFFLRRKKTFATCA